MRINTTLVIPLLLAIPAVRAGDGPIDWSEAPGYKDLRFCAQPVFTECCNLALAPYLSCGKKSVWQSSNSLRRSSSYSFSR